MQNFYNVSMPNFEVAPLTIEAENEIQAAYMFGVAAMSIGIRDVDTHEDYPGDIFQKLIVKESDNIVVAQTTVVDLILKNIFHYPVIVYCDAHQRHEMLDPGMFLPDNYYDLSDALNGDDTDLEHSFMLVDL